jgi:hypothetical protein
MSRKTSVSLRSPRSGGNELLGGNRGAAAKTEGFRGRGVGSPGPAAQRGGQGGAARRGAIPAGVRVPRKRLRTSLTCTGSFSCPPEPERPQREPPNPRPAEPPLPACAMLEVRAASAPPPPEPWSRLRGPRLLGGGDSWRQIGECPHKGLAGRGGRSFSTYVPWGSVATWKA